MTQQLCVLVPCLNEAGAVAYVINDIKATLPTARIIVIDNGSTDRTAEIALAAAAEVWFEPRRGKGRAVLTALDRLDAPFVALIDGDGSYPAQGLLRLLAAQETSDADMVVGIRCPEAGTVAAFRRWHKTGASAFAWIQWFVIGWRPRDIFSGLRLLKRRFYKNVPILGKNFELEMELSVQCVEKGFYPLEVEVPFRDRHGTSPSKLRTIRDGFNILWFLISLFRDYRPFAFFSLIAAVFAICGLLAGSLPIYEYVKTGLVGRIPLAIFASGLMNIALYSLLTGVLLESGLRRQRESSQLALRNFR